MSEYTTWHVYSLFFFTHNNGNPISSSSPSNEISVISVIILWPCRPKEATASSFMRFLYHTQRRATVGRPPLGEWSARRRDLYLTTHTTYKRKTSMPPVGFEPTISAGEQPQTYALDRAATGIGNFCGYRSEIFWYGERICQFAENERTLPLDYFAWEYVTVMFWDQQKAAL